MSRPTIPLTPRQPFGPEALANCQQALATGRLSSVDGPFTSELERRFAQFYGAEHAVSASSGTAAIHSAVAALGLEPGTEVIVGPITDAGSITPLLYEGLIPTFCDLDEHLAMTPETIRPAITERTGAIMIIHLFGGVSDSAGIRRLADEHGLRVLEDCSQAHATRLGSRHVGTFGDIGMFSMQQSKHLTSGDGGVCITDDPYLAQRLRLFRDKGWDRSATAKRSYPMLGLNYRITELQSAVALPQLATLEAVVARRRELAGRLDAALSTVPGFSPWVSPPAGESSYWCYPFFVEADRRDQIAARLTERGVPVTPGYIGAPIFECLVPTQDRHTFGDSQYPFTLARADFDYGQVDLPVTRDALSRVIVFWLHEHLTDAEVDAVAGAVREAIAEDDR